MDSGPAKARSAWFNPEQAGIILDRLARELLRAPATDPAACAELQQQSREFLQFLRAALSDTCRNLTFAVPRIDRDLPPDALASILRELAARLLELIDEGKP